MFLHVASPLTSPTTRPEGPVWAILIAPHLRRVTSVHGGPPRPGRSYPHHDPPTTYDHHPSPPERQCSQSTAFTAPRGAPARGAPALLGGGAGGAPPSRAHPCFQPCLFKVRARPQPAVPLAICSRRSAPALAYHRPGQHSLKARRPNPRAEALNPATWSTCSYDFYLLQAPCGARRGPV
jgi:hypothetical protein